MATSTVTADRSSMLADPHTGALLGGGADVHLAAILNPAGYSLRGLIGFTLSSGLWAPMRKITKVELRLKGSGGGAHVGIGASPQALIRRAVSSWSANTAGESWSTTPVVYPGPSITTTNQVTAALPGAEATGLIDITALAMAWAPNSVLGPSGAPGGGAASYGVVLAELGGAANAWQGYSARHGTTANRPALVFTYETNAPPYAPTLVAPLGPDQGASKFEAQSADPEADPITAYDLHVSTDPTFAVISHWTVTASSTGLNAAGVLSRNYAGTALVNGTRYYWKTRMRDAGAYGPWSSTGTFVKAAGGGPADDAYDYWIAAILGDMAEGRTVLRVGTLRPVDDQVAELVCAEYGDLFTVKWDETSPPVDEPVYLLGERVTLSPDGWSVDAVVELKREVSALVGKGDF